LLDQWETRRFRQSDFSIPAAIEPLQYSTRRSILGHLAWAQLRRPKSQPANLFPLTDVSNAICDGTKGRLTESSLQYHLVHLPELLRQRHNILCFRGGDQFSFVHRTFLEYFGALHLHAQATEENLTPKQIYKKHILPHLGDERWQESLRLYFSFADRTKVAEIIDMLLKESEAAVSREHGSISPAPILLAAEAFHDTRQDTRPAKLAHLIAEKASVLLSSQEICRPTDIFAWIDDGYPLVRLVRALVNLDIFLGQPLQRWSDQSYGRGINGGPAISAVRELAKILDQNPAFLHLLNDFIQNKSENEYIRGQALEILGRHHGKDFEFRNLLEGLIEDIEENGLLRSQAVKVLVQNFRLDTAVCGILDSLIRAKGEVEIVRRQAVRSYGETQLEVPAIEQLLQSIIDNDGEQNEIRQAAAEVLYK
jgi:hypothetical protein